MMCQCSTKRRDWNRIILCIQDSYNGHGPIPTESVVYVSVPVSSSYPPDFSVHLERLCTCEETHLYVEHMKDG